jgi:hypothetical protein
MHHSVIVLALHLPSQAAGWQDPARCHPFAAIILLSISIDLAN